jgi:hypothetical protein
MQYTITSIELHEAKSFELMEDKHYTYTCTSAVKKSFGIHHLGLESWNSFWNSIGALFGCHIIGPSFYLGNPAK